MRNGLLKLKEPIHGRCKGYHRELLGSEMLVWMGSENAGVCTHSSSSHLDDLLHQHFLYDVSLHFLDSKTLLNNLLELSNCYSSMGCNYFKRSYGHSGFTYWEPSEDSSTSLSVRITPAFSRHDCATEHRYRYLVYFIGYWSQTSENAYQRISTIMHGAAGLSLQ